MQNIRTSPSRKPLAVIIKEPKSLNKLERMNVNLYSIKVLKDNGKTDIYRNVTATIGENNELVFYCCDINQSANLLYGDSGVEFYLILNQRSKNKLAAILYNKKLFFSFYKNIKYTNQSLLEKIHKKFGERDCCFEEIMKFLKKHNIQYEYERW